MLKFRTMPAITGRCNVGVRKYLTAGENGFWAGRQVLYVYMDRSLSSDSIGNGDPIDLVLKRC